MQTKYLKRGSLCQAVIIKCLLITKQTDQMQTNNSVAEYVTYADKHQRETTLDMGLQSGRLVALMSLTVGILAQGRT
jgi:hypothetical protein